MLNRAASLWRNLSQGLVLLPGVLVLVFAALGIGLVELDEAIDLDGVQYVFKGDGSAARTVLSVIAGSLITVAGLTFSITMVVLQLASSQFSPRVLRTFFGDRVTQITIGTYVGTFVYALLVLRAVGSFGDTGFVPRLSVTVASLLGIAAVILLIVFLNHVAQLIQVSHVMANIARDTLARIDVLYPQPFGASVEEDAAVLRDRWRAQEPPGEVFARGPGYVQRVAVDALAGKVDRLVVLVCPGDFAGLEKPIMEVWPPQAAEACRESLQAGVTIADERDLDQDVDFGLRQLADTALKAMSPGINDPMTAITCVNYMRAILVRLAERAAPPSVRRFEDPDRTVVLRRREFDEYLDGLAQISRYVGGDAWVAGAMLDALASCATVAVRGGSRERARSALAVGKTIAERIRAEAGTERDRESVDVSLGELVVAAGDHGGARA